MLAPNIAKNTFRFKVIANATLDAANPQYHDSALNPSLEFGWRPAETVLGKSEGPATGKRMPSCAKERPSAAPARRKQTGNGQYDPRRLQYGVPTKRQGQPPNSDDPVSTTESCPRKSGRTLRPDL